MPPNNIQWGFCLFVAALLTGCSHTETNNRPRPFLLTDQRMAKAQPTNSLLRYQLDVSVKIGQIIRREREKYPNLTEVGDVTLTFKIYPDGNISDTKTTAGTNYPALVKLAQDALKAATPFEPWPVMENEWSKEGFYHHTQRIDFNRLYDSTEVVSSLKNPPAVAKKEAEIPSAIERKSLVSSFNPPTEQSYLNYLHNKTNSFPSRAKFPASTGKKEKISSPPEWQDYDADLVTAVQNRWFDLMEPAGGFYGGKVVVKFNLQRDGLIKNVRIVENSAGNLRGTICLLTLNGLDWKRPWPDKVLQKGDENDREIFFTFIYEPFEQ